MKHWYALHTKPNAEYQVAMSLQRRGIQTYLPSIEAPQSRRGRRQVPFFPCYLFVRADFEAIGLSQVRWVPGLRRIVAFDDQPARLPDDAVDLVQRNLDVINTTGAWPGHNFESGDTVRITQGPFKDLLAIFEGPTTPAERVRVLLSILGHASRVHVPVTDLEKAPSGVQAPAARWPRRTRGRGRPIQND